MKWRREHLRPRVASEKSVSPPSSLHRHARSSLHILTQCTMHLYSRLHTKRRQDVRGAHMYIRGIAINSNTRHWHFTGTSRTVDHRSPWAIASRRITRAPRAPSGLSLLCFPVTLFPPLLFVTSSLSPPLNTQRSRHIPRSSPCRMCGHSSLVLSILHH